MNFTTFQSFISPFISTGIVKDSASAADKLSLAYHISNIGQTTTPFGAPLINADRQILKTFLQLGMDINFYGASTKSFVSSILASIDGIIQLASRPEASKQVASVVSSIQNQISSFTRSLPAPLSFIGPIISQLVNSIVNSIIESVGNITNSISSSIKKLKGIVDSLDVAGIAYMTMAIGFCLYWATAQFSPMPPMPPCIAPSPGVQILFPGTPVPLNSALKEGFKQKQSGDVAIRTLYNCAIAHQFTIVGLYNGLLPSPIGPVGPVPIPWFSLINIPQPPIPSPSGLIDSLKDNIIDKAQFSDRLKTVPLVENRFSPFSRTK